MSGPRWNCNPLQPFPWSWRSVSFSVCQRGLSCLPLFPAVLFGLLPSGRRDLPEWGMRCSGAALLQVKMGDSGLLGRIETFRLSEGGCSRYRCLVNVCGAWCAPKRVRGSFVHVGYGLSRLVTAGPRGCPPPLGLAGPLFPVPSPFSPGPLRHPCWAAPRAGRPSCAATPLPTPRGRSCCRGDDCPGLADLSGQEGFLRQTEWRSGLAVERVPVLASGYASPGEGTQEFGRGVPLTAGEPKDRRPPQSDRAPTVAGDVRFPDSSPVSACPARSAS